MSHDIEPTPHVEKCVTDNLAVVRQQIQSACARSGRDSDVVRLVAVTKYAELTWIEALHRAGVSDFGENRPQQLVARTELFDPTIRWHMIGQLQRNKVRPTLQRCHLIHSVDSWRLLDRIELIATELQLKPGVLLEANVSGEAAKSGFDPGELRAAASNERLTGYQHMDIRGMMTMAPQSRSPEHARPVFASLRELRDEIATSGLMLPELSMGMSGDFEIAVEEGATIVRIGRRLYEGCQ
jgi:pyridoxal phosphate enzyme (YggS family)